MKTNRIYKFSILLLVVLNLSTLGFIWFHQRNGERSGKDRRVADFVSKELSMTEGQKEAYEQLRGEHKSNMVMLSMRDNFLHKKFFGLILSGVKDSSVIYRVADSIASNRRQMEIVTYHHFSRIYALLDHQQQLQFRRVFREVIRRVLPPPPPPPGGPPRRDNP